MAAPGEIFNSVLIMVMSILIIVWFLRTFMRIK
jgi:hypothetical protein